MAETATETDSEKKGGGSKLIIIGAAVLVVLMAGVYFFVLAPKGDEVETVEPEAPMFSTEPGVIVPVDEVTVSLGGDEPHFAMVEYSAVLSLDAEQALVEAELDRLRSNAQLVFRSYEADVLDTPEGFAQLQSDLTAVAQQLWPDGEVLEVLVTSLLVQ